MRKVTPFSAMLKELVADQKLTLRDLAKRSGIKPSTLGDWLAGASPRDMRQVRSVAKVLGVTFELLACGDEEVSFERALNSMPRALVLQGDFRIKIEKIGAAAVDDDVRARDQIYP